MIITQLHETNRTSDHDHEVLSADFNDDRTVCEVCHGAGEVFQTSLSEGRATLACCTACEGTGFKPALMVPRTTVVESAGWLIIDIEIPDVMARDLDLEIDDDQVKVRTLPSINASDSPVRITRKPVSTPMERVIELPRPIDLDRSSAIRANLLDGVLRMVLPITGSRSRAMRFDDLSDN